jgi:hypothetical protein
MDNVKAIFAILIIIAVGCIAYAMGKADGEKAIKDQALGYGYALDISGTIVWAHEWKEAFPGWKG